VSLPRDRLAARAEQQRSRILDAAKEGFVADGFSAATVATIAERAGVSAGLIYRYFESKQAIVLAIIERELAHARERIGKLHGSVDLVEGLLQTFADFRACEPEVMSGALYLEMSAAATRDPEIAAAIRHADRLTRGDFQAWLERPVGEGGRGMAREQAAVRATVVQLAVAGLAVRAAREPDMDLESLRAALVEVLA
jgi:AcrR family transcriptional regulator